MPEKIGQASPQPIVMATSAGWTVPAERDQATAAVDALTQRITEPEEQPS